MKVRGMSIKPPNLPIDVKTELLNTLEVINNNLKQVTSDEEHAILLNAKANTLLALQKYE
jgi:hypothetical protein